MSPHTNPDLIHRWRIARLLMVTACDWGLFTRHTQGPHACGNPVRTGFASAPARAHFPSLSGFAI